MPSQELKEAIRKQARQNFENATNATDADISEENRTQVRHDFNMEILKEIKEKWKDDVDESKKIRTFWRRAIFTLLIFEILFSMNIFLKIANDELSISSWVANVFFLSVFTQVAYMARQIIVNLFPANKGSFIELIKYIGKD